MKYVSKKVVSFTKSKIATKFAVKWKAYTIESLIVKIKEAHGKKYTHKD